MKLIIDIPDDVYEDIEHCKGDYINYYINSLNWAVRNGTPYEERPKGEWIIDGHHIRCNRCNEYICNTDREGDKIPDSFCSNCGADMRGEEK